MADAGRHSDLTFVSSFVSELDVAVVCVHEKVVQTFAQRVWQIRKKKKIDKTTSTVQQKIKSNLSHRLPTHEREKTAGAEIDMTRD